ncbi:MAG: peptidylprolyl isomerase [Gammaproteobacteria bacterium]|jgi:FKBP-type peptidyl-prolyl cis-trans isomerase SlyD
MKIATNTVVTVDYRLTNEDREEIDSSENGQAIVYLHGGDELIDALEVALEGRAAGDELSVTLQPEDAYGDENPELIRNFHIDEFNGVKMVPGMELQGKDPDGNFQLLRVQEVEGDQVTVNMNHPLAGMVLRFDLKVKEVRAATAEELAHGHAHDDAHGEAHG